THVSGVLLSYDLWKRDFNADPDIIGRAIQVNNFSANVVGVMPPDFRLYFGQDSNIPPKVDLYFPADLGPESLGTSRITHDIITVGRLKPGATLEQAQKEIDAIAERMIVEHPKAYEQTGLRFHLMSLHMDVVQAVRPAIITLLAAVGFVLLIA